VSDVQQAIASLPKSKIVVRRGRVAEVQEWTLWNLVPWITIEIRREGKGFFAAIGDPEHGGGSDRGPLAKVLAGLHPKIRANYERLFALRNPTAADIRTAGFKGYEITFEPAKAAAA
jgi:hypothetical protein